MLVHVHWAHACVGMCVFTIHERVIACLLLLTSQTSDLSSGYMTVPVMVPSSPGSFRGAYKFSFASGFDFALE